MKASASEFANLIGRTLISASNRSIPTRTWNPSLEQTLHQLGFRDSLTPSLVARVIDPFLVNHHSLALGFFNWASQQPGFSHTPLTYQSILKSLSVSRQFNAVDKLLRQIKARKVDLDPSIYHSIIASQIIGKKTQNAFAIFNEVSSLNHDIGPSTCNSLLAALSSDGYMSNAHKVFDDMIQRGVSFSTLGFGVFIWRFCRNAELGKTLSLLDEVRKGVSEINGSIVAVLIVHGLCMESRVAEAFWVLDELRKRDFKPDFMAYRIVVEAFRLIRSVVDVDKVLKKKRKLGVAPRANDYREFIFALISERRICEAKELGEVIVSGNFPIDDDVLNALIGSISTIDTCSGMLFFKFMIEKEGFLTPLTLSNLSRNLCKFGKIDELLEVFQILSAKEYFSDMESYHMMVSFLCKAGRVREAYGVLQEMKKKGLSPDVSFYNSLMEACCKQELTRPAKRLWDEMFASGCDGNLKTYNILIRKFSETGQIEEAQRLFSHMLDKRVAPDALTYTSLLEGLCQEKMLDDAFDIFNRSIEQDARLAQTILRTFVLSLCKEGCFRATSRFLCDLSNEIGQSDSHLLLVKCLVDAKEIAIAIEHIKWVGDNAPSMMQVISTELSASLSYSSKQEPVLQLLQGMQQKNANSNNDDSVTC
ncbi:pentatricopeptide repeat-containing protein At5g14080 [Cornus florida]|uniref:pentatricopeptide repeat-containing protein At5g14080 n=1 Tax=Cornus florida TaxID=4283 RepID=UPI00289CB711|nr:pentatricopeptide repeat-containing protein At5g14080 [Cornus florida]